MRREYPRRTDDVSTLLLCSYCAHCRRTHWWLGWRSGFSLSSLHLDDRLGHHGLLAPGKEDPRVLAHFGDVAVDRRPARGFGIDGGEMRLGHKRAHGACGDPGIDQVVARHPTPALCFLRPRALQHLNLTSTPHTSLVR